LRPRPQIRRETPRGLTLIELMVALVIIALLFSATVMGVGALTGTKAKSAASDLAAAMRSLYDTAALTGKTCRLVFQLPNERDPDQSIIYSAECATGDITARSDRDQALKDANKELEEKKKRDKDKRPTAARTLRKDEQPSLEEVMAQEKSRVEAQARFQAFNTPEIQARQLSGVQIWVWTQHQREPTRHGVAYLYFFPQGFTERAQVYFKQGANVWTLQLSPLTGKVKVVGEELEVPKV
jgi:general secretion pathway protein H